MPWSALTVSQGTPKATQTMKMPDSSTVLSTAAWPEDRSPTDRLTTSTPAKMFGMEMPAATEA